MGTCRNNDIFNDAIGENTGVSAVLSLIYTLATQTGDAVRIGIVFYLLIVFIIFVAFLSRATVQYIRDVYHAFIPDWTHATTAGIVAPPRGNWTQTDPSVLALWALLKFVITGIVLPIPTSLVCPLWLPIVLMAISNHALRHSILSVAHITAHTRHWISTKLERPADEDSLAQQQQQ